MTDIEKIGLELQRARKEKGLSQVQLAALVNKADPSLHVANSSISDIETGKMGSGPVSNKTREVMKRVLGLAQPAPMPTTAKTITVQPGEGFSFEASKDVVKRLATLGLPTGEVKASLVKAFSELLDQAEK